MTNKFWFALERCFFLSWHWSHVCQRELEIHWLSPLHFSSRLLVFIVRFSFVSKAVIKVRWVLGDVSRLLNIRIGKTYIWRLMLRIYMHQRGFIMRSICGNSVKDYEQSLFPLRDSRGKQTSEWGRNRLPRWNVTRVSSCECSEPVLHSRVDMRVAFQRGRRCSRPLACSFPSTIPERKRDCS